MTFPKKYSVQKLLNDGGRIIQQVSYSLFKKPRAEEKCVIKACSHHTLVEYYRGYSFINYYYYPLDQQVYWEPFSPAAVYSAADRLIWQRELTDWLWHHGSLWEFVTRLDEKGLIHQRRGWYSQWKTSVNAQLLTMLISDTSLWIICQIFGDMQVTGVTAS